MSTIVDVAKLAQVSRVTVTRVLNEPEKVKPETRLRVEKAIATLNYVPNLSARSLVSKSSGVIGMLVPDNVSGFFGSVMSTVHKQVNARGKMLMVLECADRDEEENALRKLNEINCDGFLLYVRHVDTEKIKSYTGSKPVVLLDASSISDIPSVSFEHYQAAYAATSKLIGQGHHKIAIVAGPDDRPSAIKRFNGCLDAICQAGLPWDPGYSMSGPYDQIFGESATFALLEKKPDISALVYSSERACSGGLRALRRLGRRVPEDISVISFDSFGLTEYLSPHIDSVIYPVSAMAEYGVKEVITRVFNKDYQMCSQEFTHYFVEGESINPLS